MPKFEDHFSERAAEYARHRPRYPAALFAWLASAAPRREVAWDCGTGNGQAAVALAEHFQRVIATDASADQLRQAEPHDRVEYRVERAEDIGLAPGTVDLITVAAAAHWFDHAVFHDAVRRVAGSGGVVAAWTYHMPIIEPKVDAVLVRYYEEVVGSYWPPGFEHVASHYRTLPFPFDEVPAPAFEMEAEWDLARLSGFVSSWSASQRYWQQHHRDPVDAVRTELEAAWGEPARTRIIRWPLYLRVGRVIRSRRADPRGA